MKTNGDENTVANSINDGGIGAISYYKVLQIANSQKCYKEYSYHEDHNLKFRNSMEDFPKVVDYYMGDPGKAFFSLYDGHGGIEPVKYVKDRMPELFAQCLVGNTVESALTESFT